MKHNILLFIPCYNCEKQILRVLDQLDEETMSYIRQVLIVNNRSTDGTEAAVQQYLESHPALPAVLVRNNENYGLGGSHKVAFQYAMDHDFDYVIVLHGDDQGAVADIVPHIENGEAEGYDSFLGSRFAKGAKLYNYSKFRIFGNWVFNGLISMAAARRLNDLGSGLNMYKTRYLASHFYMGFPDNLTFNVYMLLYGVYAKSQFAFFPLTWREEDQVSNARFFRQAKEILGLIMQYVFQREKLFMPAETQRAYGFEVVYEGGRS